MNYFLCLNLILFSCPREEIPPFWKLAENVTAALVAMEAQAGNRAHSDQGGPRPGWCGMVHAATFVSLRETVANT